MRQKSGPEKQPAEDAIKDIRRATRRHFSAEEKIRVVLEGLRGEESIAELCRRQGIASSMYYGWSKEFLEAGKRRLAGDTARAATSDEVKDLRREAQALKEVVADLTLENRLLKKSMIGNGGGTRHEILSIRQNGDYPAGRAIAFAGSADAGQTRDSQIVFLPLV
jgi:transposase